MKTFDTPAPITVSLELGVGDVQIEASDRTDTTEVRPSDPRRRPTWPPPSRPTSSSATAAC